MSSIMQWCNDNQGVIAAIGILIVVVPAIFGLIPKCAKYIQQKQKEKKDDVHKADLEAVIEYLRVNTVANTKKLAKVLNKSAENIQKLLSELIDQGIVKAAVDNCELSNPKSVWQLKRR